MNTLAISFKKSEPALKGEKDMKTKMILTGMMVAVLLVFFSVPCFSQTIYGCYKKSNGALRIVADHSLCKVKKNSPLHLMLVSKVLLTAGEQGPTRRARHTGNPRT